MLLNSVAATVPAPPKKRESGAANKKAVTGSLIRAAAGADGFRAKAGTLHLLFEDRIGIHGPDSQAAT